jgi:hypothetical protein
MPIVASKPERMPATSNLRPTRSSLAGCRTRTSVMSPIESSLIVNVGIPIVDRRAALVIGTAPQGRLSGRCSITPLVRLPGPWRPAALPAAKRPKCPADQLRTHDRAGHSREARSAQSQAEGSGTPPRPGSGRSVLNRLLRVARRLVIVARQASSRLLQQALRTCRSTPSARPIGPTMTLRRWPRCGCRGDVQGCGEVGADRRSVAGEIVAIA